MRNFIKYFYRKVRMHSGLWPKYVTERIGDFIMSYIPSTDIGARLYRGWEFENDEIAICCKYINKDSVVLDIGANIGLHALSYSSIAKTVIAFEPQPETFKTLTRNIYQNNIKNIIPLNVAITDTAEISTFNVVSDEAYSSLIDTGRKRFREKINVLCETVDGLLGDMKIDFIKIDVEGVEFKALQGMSKLIEKHKPIIFCEIYQGHIKSYDPNKTIDYMRNFGYIVYRFIGGGMVEMSVFTKHEDCYCNYLFIPVEGNNV